MFTKIFKLLAIALLIPMLGSASTDPVYPESITITTNAFGEVLDISAPTSWTNGNINSYYLDNTHTQKTFNDIRLEPGTYEWKLRTIKRNNKPGKVNLDITVKYQNGSNSKKVDQKLSPDRTDTGTFNVEDYRSQSSGSPAGYSKVKVHIGRAAINTNVRYKITLTRKSGTTNGNSGTANNSGNNCNYSGLGNKNGNVVGNTVGKYTATKKACKNTATVRVQKTGGKARTTVLIYASTTRNGTGSLIKSEEFPNGRAKTTKNISVSNVNGKFIRVELKNRSAANTFQYKLYINQ